jgi:hypothetical protein
MVRMKSLPKMKKRCGEICDPYDNSYMMKPRDRARKIVA